MFSVSSAMYNHHLKKRFVRCQRALLLLALWGLAGSLPAAAGPPLRDSLQVAAILLYQGDSSRLEAPLPGEPLWVPKKELPYSADLYLGSSGKINAAHPKVTQAVADLRRQVAGHTGPSAYFDTPRHTMKAVWSWVEKNIEWQPTHRVAAGQATQWSLLWPSADESIEQGRGDDFCRVRVAVAMMRAFKVPARPCWFRGRPAVQFWVQPADPSSKKKSKGKAPRGYWELNHERYAGEAVDSYALKVGDFDWIEWQPAQEMSVRALPLQQAYYPLHLSGAAQADFEFVQEYGSLPESPGGTPLPPPPPPEGKGSTPWLRLVRVAFELTADGALQALQPVRLLVPYLDHQDFNLEAPPRSPRVLKIKAKSIWTNRPGRLLREEGRDYYEQSLPAMGYYHQVGLRLAMARTLLHAELQEGRLRGRVLRADNLAPLPEAQIQVEAVEMDGKGEAFFKPLRLDLDAAGNFDVPLPAQALDNPWLKVSAGRTNEAQEAWEVLILPTKKELSVDLPISLNN
jgi:hypothetical protein